MENILVEGIRVFKKHENAPDFVRETVIITPRELVEFIKANGDLLTEYNGKKQLKCQIMESKSGSLYLKVDNYKAESEPETEPEPTSEDELPF